MENLLTLREAGDRLGIDRSVLKRLLKEGKLPEAEKIRKPEGWVWVIPDMTLKKLENDPDLVIDVRNKTTNYENSDPDNEESTIDQETKNSHDTTQFELIDDEEHDFEISEPEFIERRKTTEYETEQISDQETKYEHDTTQFEVIDGEEHDFEISESEFIERRKTTEYGTEQRSDQETKPDEKASEKLEEKKYEIENTISHLTLASNQKEQEVQHIAELIDMALLDRLLAIQEAKAEAASRAEQAEYALEAAKMQNQSLYEELSVEKQEKSTTAEQLREERLARKIADVKIAELNEKLIRETAMADAERKERIAATERTVEAEQKATYALASMNRFSRKKYEKTIKRDS